MQNQDTILFRRVSDDVEFMCFGVAYGVLQSPPTLRGNLSELIMDKGLGLSMVKARARCVS
jgi:hypothetical protein